MNVLSNPFKITLHLSTMLALIGSFSASAQIVPDATLPNNSAVSVEGQINRITGGTSAGSNLFHSFSSFSLPTGTTAHFDSALDIQNIFSRVTGSSISNIDGLIQANGSANLFLINPNGIIFGPNARLNIGGSFLASTANSIVFNDSSLFSAKNPQAPPLLTVNVPIGLQFGSNPGSIAVQGQGLNQPDTGDDIQAEIAFQQSVLESPIGLGVQPARTLALVGGDITFSGGLLKAPAGRIELGSVRDNSSVSLTPTGTGFALGYENVATFKDIQASGQSAVFASGEGGGDIQLAGRRIQLSEGSQIQASTLGAQPGGNVRVRAAESVFVSGTSADGETPSSFVAGTFSTGNAGNVRIETGQLVLRDGGVIGVASLSEGDAGNVTVRATESVEITGNPTDGEIPSALVALTNGSGNAGDVTIETRQLTVRDGAVITAGTESNGNAGNVTVRATESVEIIGSAADGEINSSLAATTTGIGDAGDVTIETKQLTVRNGAIIGAATGSEGNAGNVTVRATDSVEIIGISPDGETSSGLVASTSGIGNAGNLTIETGQLTILAGGAANAATFSSGEGGNVIIRATESVEITGISTNGLAPSRLTTQTFASGNAGNISIETGRLTLQDGAQIQLGAEFATTGNAGNLTIRATESIQMTGTSPDGEKLSGLVAGTFGAGNAGDVTLETGQLTVQNGAQIAMGTFGAGNGGNLTLRAPGNVDISSGGSIFAGTLGAGNAGSATIETRQLTVSDGGLVFVGTLPTSEGQGGNLTVRATDSIELNGASADKLGNTGLVAYTFGFGDAGDVTIETRRLVVRNGAQVSVGTLSFGPSSNAQGGNLTVRATDSVELIGTSPDGQSPSGLSAATNTAGDAGDVIVNTQRLVIGDGAQITVNGLGSGNPGSIDITSGDMRLFNQGKLTATSETGKGGNITLRAGNIQLRHNSEISATGSQTGNLTTEGNITIEPVTLVLLEGSRIITNAGDPGGGSNITINPFAGSDLAVFKSPDSIINAVGDLNIQGNVSVQPADVPEVEVTNIEGLISAGCEDVAGSEFIVTGRGGLPPNPSAPLSSNTALVEWATRDAGADELSKQPSTTPSAPTTQTPLVEAQGWIVAADGTITLTAEAPTTTPHSLGFTHPSCQN
ncbi:filamentous hemagglutinin N-terminal domain-containing protein [Microcoleus sp. FACHB-672]|uniref:two-partner secretion domain-containing protein n=1 Tax=Microcoleus sp. FACHB-672 TaxID=2692825 RepID=UPI0016891445|nr:filamentous hemagglutinin N-terminal domain-containing protein [Microcoleus sp. FACHB-672]MBD2042912.1 filamentous hemagglutinin N-terminal domain-containing protein [Microcoleus sp. FACHB-672]